MYRSHGQTRDLLWQQPLEDEMQQSKAYAKIENFRVEDTNKNRVVFDATLDVTGLNTTGFTIFGKTISSVTLNADKLGGYFTVSSDFDFWNNNTIRLEGGKGTVLDFALQYISNNIAEPSSSKGKYVSANAEGVGVVGSKVDPWTLAEAFSKLKINTPTSRDTLTSGSMDTSSIFIVILTNGFS